MADPTQSLLVLGASRGLGLGMTKEFLARGWAVVATSRGSSEGLAELKTRHPDRLRLETLDINDPAAARYLASGLGDKRVTILFVNAGVVDDKRPADQSEIDEFTRLMTTNALSPIRMIEIFAPLLATPGVIGVMSSGLGSVTNNTGGGWDVYRASKAALNTLLRSRAARHREGPAHLAIAPGWVRTDMGGPTASLDVATAMRGVADVLISRIGSSTCEYLDYKGSAVAW
ncbi:SDR family NAD(P)-dependent oxidoreductase [Lichenifustis flavocetrariae]|uniref:SDR family NAD(P)-dependent oxidoreductase n=1 Tax=Lichenifustis flavocetrariae TaxID=2949735 RepID=A0AA41Z140_9HYPH|nr:SDR family NAD(P)-dependent oxidoreductase [Lichenifustis flavocetrariae]MCW6510888.1 SDR family NAD(P)-dependent oxidoreductase [Lichenifustis flavocetrariae]